MDWKWLVMVAAAFLAATTWLVRRKQSASAPAHRFQVGQITPQTLGQYAGYDFTKPILLAVKGVVFDVTMAAQDFAPGKPLHVYAGKEVARALALGSTSPSDVGSDVLHDLPQACLDRLDRAAEDYKQRFDVVGELIPLKEFTLEELAQHDGVARPGGPLLLAIQGTVFDVSRGSQFYGPEGMYPFAGKECARALALMSTDLADCTAKVDDLSYTERETLREWTAKFTFKYPILGRVVAAEGAKENGGSMAAAAATTATTGTHA